MIVLYETAAGFALFKVKDEGKLSDVEVSFLVSFLNLESIVYCSCSNVKNLCRIWEKSSPPLT